ncbi:MAG: hypothetical protein ACJAZN_001367 [Planctomycetota bacterium]|jgi:hypothetical protein
MLAHVTEMRHGAGVPDRGAVAGGSLVYIEELDAREALEVEALTELAQRALGRPGAG